jgi:hypothetical protein
LAMSRAEVPASYCRTLPSGKVIFIIKNARYFVSTETHRANRS